MSDSIVCTIDGDVLRVTLNEAASGNAMTNEMSARLAEILEGAGDVARLVVLRAAGDVIEPPGARRIVQPANRIRPLRHSRTSAPRMQFAAINPAPLSNGIVAGRAGSSP